jgi:hypothetical protein
MSERMTEQEKTLGTHERMPPVWLVRTVSWLRDYLERIRWKLAPAHVSTMELSLSFWYTQAIYVAAKVGIADHLANGPRTPAELATATGMDAPSLFRLLRALSSIGIFAEDKRGRFSLTPMADSLRTDAPNSVRAVAIMAGEDWWWRAWGKIAYSVQTGKSSFEHVHGMAFFDYMKANPEAGAVFDSAMTAYSIQTAYQVAVAYPFPARGVLVDVGGGHGELITTILRLHPGLRGILMDLPSTLEASPSLVESKELSGRCEIVGGDFFKAVPEGGDIYLLKHVLHDWDDERATTILENCHRAMLPGAKLLLVEMVIPTGNRPFLGKFLDLGVLMMADGARERTEPEYRDLLSAAGFNLTHIRSLPSPDSVIEAVRRPN